MLICGNGGTFNQNRTVLAGIPRETLLLWQTQLQTAMLNLALGAQPVELSYMQGDGRKHVSFNVANQAAAESMLRLVNYALGLSIGSRRPARLFFR